MRCHRSQILRFMHDYYATFSLLKLQRPAVWDMSSKFILAKLRYCIKSNAGVTAVEYGLIAAATAFATALGMVALGPTVAGLYQMVVEAF
jgi:Flp pilus assembly pilin Flp